MSNNRTIRMKKIISINDATKISKQLKLSGKTIVLVGGCFDILHVGHILFLKAAKKQGDILFLLLESDENIRKRKGKKRPLNTQRNRAVILSALEAVDYIVPLVGMTKNEEYDRLMIQIKPDVVAMTAGDSEIERRANQCKAVGAKLKLVIKEVDKTSTTDLIDEIKNKYGKTIKFYQ